MGEQLPGSDSPDAGDQEQFTPPDPDRGADAPAQIAAEPRAAAAGEALTAAVVTAGDKEQLPAVTVTLYSPEAAVVAFGTDGFCSLDVKPFGPVQLYVPPSTGDAVRWSVCPSQIGPSFPATGGGHEPIWANTNGLSELTRA